MPKIVVQVSINDQPPLPFVVDTGTTAVLLSIEPWAAKKLGLPFLVTHKDAHLSGQPGQHTVTSTVLRTVKIIGTDKHNNLDLKFTPPRHGGKYLEKDTPFHIVSVLLDPNNPSAAPQGAGIIPASLLSLGGMVCQFDFQRKVLIFVLKAKDWKPAAGSVVIPLVRNSPNDLYRLTATLATGESLKFVLDTGCPTTQVYNMLALAPPDEQSAQDVYEYPDRQRSYDNVLLSRLQVGAFIEPNVAVCETDTSLSLVSNNFLGLDFLSRFLVTLDLADNKMYLKRRSDYAQRASPQGRAGVRLEKRADQYAAAWVEPDSPAYQAGLRTGDHIEQLDGQPLGALQQWDAQKLLDGLEGTSAKLEVRTIAGKEGTLSFARSKKFFGHRHALLGVSLDWFQGDFMMVAEVTAGSPLKHILKSGDEFYSVNGLPVAKMTMDEAFQQLERPDVALQVWRPSDKTWQDLHLAPLPAQTQVISGPLPAVNRYSFDSKVGWTAAPL